MSFKKLSIVSVLFLVVLLLASRVLAAVVASITIGDQQIDLSDPNASVNITLSADSPSVPIVITYDDGSTGYLAFTFNYVPPAPVSSGGGGSQTCDEADSFSCTGANAGCGSQSGEMKKTTRYIDCSETYVTYCDASCAPPVVGGGGGGGSSCTPNCSQEPNVCSGEIFNDGCGGTCVGSKDCAAPPECEDVYYCDNGTTIHKYGGYWDGNTCQYAFDPGDPC